MRRSHIILGVAAIAVAGISSVMVSNYVDRTAEEQAQAVAAAKEQAVKERPAVSIKSTAVLVASESLDIGDSVDGKLSWLDWPDAAVGSITASGGSVARQDSDKPVALEGFAGAVARIPIPKGQPITQDTVVTPGKGAVLSALIHPGMRAVTIPIDHTSGVGGMLQPGDNVDVMLSVPLADQGGGTVDPQTGLARPKTAIETIIRRAHILSVDRRISTGIKAAPGAELPNAPPPTTVTLELSEHDASRLTMASQMGRITLALAPLAREKGGVTPGAGQVVTDVQVMPKLRAARAGVTPDKIADLPFLPPAPAAPLQADNDATPAPDAKAAPRVVTIYHWTTPVQTVPPDGSAPTGQNAANK